MHCYLMWTNLNLKIPIFIVIIIIYMYNQWQVELWACKTKTVAINLRLNLWPLYTSTCSKHDSSLQLNAQERTQGGFISFWKPPLEQGN